MKFYKTVLLPIMVSVGDYCWGDQRICGHFDNEGGHPYCQMSYEFNPLKQDRKGRIPKPEKCKNLKEVE